MINVYSASAGSGKTHLLTGYYLTLLLRLDWTPAELNRCTEYYEVLAVTFTNKATAEMKERIVKELHTLATDPTRSPYIKQLCKECDIDKLQHRAQTLIEKILCDYSNFNVTTIDRFFQKVIRAFMRELDLPSGYEVQLDSDLVLDAAVDRFISSLDNTGAGTSGQHSEVYRWIRSFSRNNIAQGNGWDVRQAIRELADQLMSEEYQRHRDSIRELTLNKDRLNQYRQQLNKLCKDFTDATVALGQAFCEWAEGNIDEGINGFSGKTRSPMRIFLSWSQGKTDKYKPAFSDLLNDPASCFKGGKYPDSFSGEQIGQLSEFLNHAQTLFGEPFVVYNSAQAILKQLYQLGTLAHIDEAVHQYCSDQSMVLIGSTNALLSRLVEGDDSPFVYAKVGTRYRSFMIDEFQDTSGMQWRNFLPLLTESNAAGQRNLIVGDVKQSIYRFRGSDWSLLQSGLFQDFPVNFRNLPATSSTLELASALIADNETLRTNWRSLRSLVWLNNRFFSAAARQMAYNLIHRTDKKAGKSQAVEEEIDLNAMSAAQTITDIYSDVEQHYRPVKGNAPLPPGLTEIQYLTPDSGQKQSFDECAAQHLPETVDRLLKAGFRLRDIAILARTNKQCQLAAQSLLDAGYNIISNKALRLDGNEAIKTIIALMRHLQHPHDRLLRAMAGFQMEAVIDRQREMGDVVDDYFRLLDEQLADQEESVYLLPVLPQLAHLPLYELVERLIGLLPPAVQQEHLAYLQALRDLVIQFIAQQTPDLTAFMRWWEEKGGSSSIATPEGEDAISIMTIHQSKGLGMPAVIYPYAVGNLDLEGNIHQGGILWCCPDHPALQFNGASGSASSLTPAFPIKCKADLKDTVFAGAYAHERLCTIIDALNTAYVAFTRAKEALIIFTQSTALKKPYHTLEANLELFRQDFAENLDVYRRDFAGTADDPDLLWEVDDQHLCIGRWVREARCQSPQAADGDTSRIRHLPPLEVQDDGATSPLPRLSMRQSRLKSNSPAIKRGNEMHLRLEHVHTLDDLGPDDQELRDLILSDATTRSWFAPGITVFNEQPIVLASGIEKRPDRIIVDASGCCTVIDYKTSQLPEGVTCLPKHEKQVRIYMSLLRSMYPRVRGFLWYLSSGSYHEVTLQSRPRQLTLQWDE